MNKEEIIKEVNAIGKYIDYDFNEEENCINILVGNSDDDQFNKAELLEKKIKSACDYIDDDNEYDIIYHFSDFEVSFYYSIWDID